MKKPAVAAWPIAALAAAAMAIFAMALASAAPAIADSADVVSTAASALPASGKIESASEVVDPMFGQRAHVLGLQRRVELRQWQADASASGGYVQVWSSAHITQGLDARHANPAQFPIDGQRWWTSDARLDGSPVAPEVLTAIAAVADSGSEWVTLAPDASRLPENLAATFQPDGKTLSTSQDPTHPRIGDVRVQWSIMTDAIAPDGLRLVDGRWVLAAAPDTGVATPPVPDQPTPVASPSETAGWLHDLLSGRVGLSGLLAALVLLGVLVAILVGLSSRRRR